MKATRASLIALVFAMGGCDWSAFDAYRVHTPVVSLTAPRSYVSARFGTTAGSLSDATSDWVVLSGGLNTDVAALPLASGSDVLPTSVAPRLVCGQSASCGPGQAGTALVGVPRWGAGTRCVMTGRFGATHSVLVRCLDSDPPTTSEILPPAGYENAGFGLALAAPRVRSSADAASGDLVFVGAPADAGRIFAAQPGRIVDISPRGLPAGAALGEVLAAGRILGTGGAPDDVLLVAGAPGVRAIYVLRGEPRAARPMTLLGCVVHAEEPGFGGAVAVGDIDGDSSDDVIAAARAEEPGRLARVHVFLTSALPSTAVCDALAWRGMSFECAEVPGRGAQCAGGAEGFGAALAAGDLDGDGHDEVLVGAPGATVEGASEAGAVWVLRATRVAGGPLVLTAADVLRDAFPEAGARLGAVVLAPRVAGRDEALAGVPGAREALLFLCSGLEGDRPLRGNLDAQCRPR